jgi:hypothetical protein
MVGERRVGNPAKCDGWQAGKGTFSIDLPAEDGRRRRPPAGPVLSS